MIATDSAGLAATASVQIQVFRIAPPTTKTLRAQLNELADTLAGSTIPQANAAAQDLQSADNDALWESDDAISGEDVFKAMREAAKDLAKADPTDPSIIDVNATLIAIAQTLATDAVNAATDLKPQKAIKAQRELNDAMAYAAAGDISRAIDQFRIAWKSTL